MSAPETPAPLVALSDAPGEFGLRKESWRSGVHELVAEAGPVARLDYRSWSGRARADTAEGTWGLSRVKGFSSSRVEITEGDGGPEVAQFDKKTWTRGGRIDLDGRTYVLGARGIFKPTWTWTHDGTTLVELALSGSLGRDKGVARVSDVGRADTNVSLFVLLALHVSVADDKTAATVAATT